MLDSDTGEMLEYCHLIMRPKYKEVWGDAYGEEIGRIAQGIPEKRYPLQFLCDLVNAVLDGDTGEMFEYCHLITRPK